MISSVDVGEQRLIGLVEKYGKELFQQTVRDLMDYSERRMRAEISAIPDGLYRFEDVLENDGIEDRPYTIRVKVHVQGDEIVVDYTGTSAQARGPINATLGVTWSATYNGLLQHSSRSSRAHQATAPPKRTRVASAAAAASGPDGGPPIA